MIPNLKLIDLTHALHPQIPCWEGGCGFRQKIKVDYEACQTLTKFRVYEISMQAGIGTHMDAPAHCFPGAISMADIPLEQLFSPAVVIDVSSKANESYLIRVEDIFAFEARHGEIPPKSFVIFYTGWDKFWSQPEYYRNQQRFPSVSAETAELLLVREISGLGIDTLSPDCGASDFPVHQIILGAGKYIVENIANASQLPAVGAYVLALPIKIAEGTEAPVRLVGFLDQEML
ncbi:MAG: kynB [Gammaproteobacteria bacterium]|nr:kynB [Gammaproteobacteria bacterium]